MRRHLNVAAVVTTFEPTDSLIENLERIAPQVRTVIVVDDTGKASRPLLSETWTSRGGVWVSNESNLGIAASLNRGIEIAEKTGHQWVVTFDDDTVVAPDYLERIFEFLEKREVPNVGVVSCSRAGGADDARTGGEYRAKRNLITSGSVFEIDLWRKLGGFDAGLFIDLVDFDFCTRVRKHGHAIVLLARQGMAHKVGNLREVRCVWTKFNIYNHAPFRLYYQTRNALFFARSHFSFDPVLSVYILLDLLRLPFKALFFETQKLGRLSFLFRGLVDGLRGRRGRLGVRDAVS